MIFSLTKAIPLVTGRGRPIFGWLATMRNSGKAVPADPNHLEAQAGSSMFGLLVSNDATRGRWL
ncbi:MAG: hypothetical protein K2P67_07965 [Gallionellaceae bacterium]|nr:hypothetical protein [Gallionellaceae bacterium]